MKSVASPDDRDLKFVACWKLCNLHPLLLHEGPQLLEDGCHAVLWSQQHVPGHKALLGHGQQDVDGNGGGGGEVLCQIPAGSS